MATFPSVVVVGNTLKLDPDLKKLIPASFSVDKKNDSNIALLDPFSLDLSSKGKEGSAKIDHAAYVPLLQECIVNHSVSKANSIHAHIVKTGTFQDVFVMTFLVNVYAKCGEMETAQKVFDNMTQRNVVSWTSLMSGYVNDSQPEVAVSVFLEMMEIGRCYPTAHTLGTLLNACSSLLSFELGKQVHAYIVKYGIEYDTGIGNALCSLYSKSGSLESAMKVFEMIGEKDAITWTTAISACGDNGSSAEGLDLFLQMLCEGLEQNEFTLTSVLSLCCVMQALSVALQVHSLTIKLGYGYSPRVKNSLMYLYLKTGQIKEAKKLFDAMETLNLVTWNAMIAGHAEMIRSEDRLLSYLSGMEALEIFTRLNRFGIVPDEFTFSSVLTVCSSLAALEQGEQIHAQTIKTGWLSDVVVGTALVNMYSKSGSISCATKAFVEMPHRTLISWTSMINAFAQHGQSQQALLLFEDMRFLGVRPNQVTFVGVLAACSHAGMVEEGLAYFDMMKSHYKIRPVMDHYACLIDMFVRLGRLEKAFDFIKKMNFEPNEVIWSILIAGCRSHGKTDLAFYAAEKLLNLIPQDPETYFYLYNMYLSAGKYQDVSRIRKMMKSNKIGKIKDYSWISIRDKVYSFKPDDKQYANGEVGIFLKELYEKAKTLGYESQSVSETVDVDDDDDDDEDEEDENVSAVHHSEKFAVAFGLMNTLDDVCIHVDKSIGVCRDCHNFMKFVSVLSSRTIIIRDSKRLHKFVNGKCSCGDFGSLL